jgi:hypothetical protein
MTVHSESSAHDEAFIGELERARESGRRVPDFFIVGHAKCGTTALYKMLGAHPQIFMPTPKETQFLSRGPRRASVRRKRAPRRPQTLEGYLSLFEAAAPRQRAGDGSTEYLRVPATARRIAALCPDARIVAAFREPVSFLRSLHLQLLEVNIEDERDFAQALRLQQARSRGEHVPRNCVWPQALQYSQHVRYVKQLREYHEHFGEERVLVLIYDDFRAANEHVVRQVLRFLDVDDAVAIAVQEANPTVRVRSQRAGALLGALSVGRNPLARTAGGAVKAVTSARTRQRALELFKRMSVDTDPPAPDEQLVCELRRRFRHEVAALSDYLSRDLLSLWGYEPGHSAPGAGSAAAAARSSQPTNLRPSI